MIRIIVTVIGAAVLLVGLVVCIALIDVVFGQSWMRDAEGDE